MSLPLSIKCIVCSSLYCFQNCIFYTFCVPQLQGISHVKEKLHFMQMENKVKRSQLAKTDALVALKREVLTRTRQARDGLRADNLKLQQRCGLLGNTTLLQDFEEKVDTSECLQQRLEMLKRRHAELTLKCAGVKQKIEQSTPEGQ